MTDNPSSLQRALIDLAHTGDFDLLTFEHRNVLTNEITNRSKNAYFLAWEEDRSIIPIKTCNHVADVALSNLATGDDPILAITDSGCFQPQSPYYDAREIAQEMVATEFPPYPDTPCVSAAQVECLQETLTEMLCDALREQDTSSAADIFSSFDRAEIVFLLAPPGHAIDATISSTRPWSDYRNLKVCDNLVHALAALGYTVSAYRAHSGNRNPSSPEWSKSRLKRPSFTRPSEPLCTLEQLEEMIENSCSQHFLICLYAIVPVSQIFDLDLSQPITFLDASIATYNPFSGTFHDAVRIQNVTVPPEMGRLISPHQWYSPEDICGLVHHHYHGNISQTAENLGTKDRQVVPTQK
ncbi:MAG: hypothetical protein JHD10_10980 [Sphingomonadaceae bacterium]|nr:hypothetical protein [Sphingomonadaceae bacterium]